MNLSILGRVRRILAEHKAAAIIVTVIAGLGTGMWLRHGSQQPSSPPTVPQLIRALQRLESPWLMEIKGTLWSMLPEWTRRWCPSLEPRPPGEARRLAAYQLGAFGTNAAAAVPALVKAFVADREVDVRTVAIGALAELGPVAQEAVPPLLAYFKDAAQGTISGSLVSRGYAAGALAIIAPAAPAVHQALLDGYHQTNDLDFRILMAAAFGKLTSPSEAIVQTLIKCSESSSPAPLREAAFRALGELGPAAAAAVPSLIASFEGLDEVSDSQPRLDPSILRRYGLRPLPAPANPVITQTNVNTLSRAGVVKVWEFPPDPLAGGAPGDGATPAATGGGGVNVGVQFTADANQVFAATMAGAQNRTLRVAVILALGKMGPQARDAVPLLQREATDPARPDGYEAAYALWRIQGDTAAVLPLFSAHLGENVPSSRRCQVIECVARLGTNGLPLLCPQLESSDTGVRFTTVRALGNLGPAALPAAARLQSLVERDPKNAIRLAAARALKRMDPERFKKVRLVLLAGEGRELSVDQLPEAARP